MRPTGLIVRAAERKQSGIYSTNHDTELTASRAYAILRLKQSSFEFFRKHRRRNPKYLRWIITRRKKKHERRRLAKMITSLRKETPVSRNGLLSHYTAR